VAEFLALSRKVSVYEEIQHPNEETEEDDNQSHLLDENGRRIGWTGSWLYTWFG
jgi:hypothetical protein